MTNYPAKIDTTVSLPTVVDNSTSISGITVNRLRDAILAIEDELGVKPSGIYGDVGTRLGTLEKVLGNLQIIGLTGDLGNTLANPYVIGIWGRPISNVVPQLNNVLTWNGISWIPGPVPSSGFSSFAGGDLSGTYPSPTVVKIQNNSIKSGILSASSDGYILTWVNSNSDWEAKPATAGFSAGGDLSGIATNQTVIGLQSKSLDTSLASLGSVQDGYTLTWVNSASSWQAKPIGGSPSGIASGDLSGTYPNPTVAKINGASVPVAGSLTSGSILTVSGASTLSYTTPTASPLILPYPISQYHKVAVYSGMSAANGVASAGLHYWGWGGPTNNGSVSSPEATAGSTATKLGATKGVTFSITTAPNFFGWYDQPYINAGVEQVGVWRGNATNRGGFLFRCRFGITSIGNTSLLHAFIGLANTTGSTSTNWVTDTTIAKLGLAFTCTTTAGSAFPVQNWQMMEGSTSLVTPHDLGASFALTLNDFIEIILYCAPNDTQISYTVNNLTSGVATSGILNTTLPSNTTFLQPWVTVGAQSSTSGTNSIKITYIYLENFDG